MSRHTRTHKTAPQAGDFSRAQPPGNADHAQSRSLPAPYTTEYTTFLVCSLSACVTRSAGMSFLRGKRARSQEHWHPVCLGAPESKPHAPPWVFLAVLHHSKPACHPGGRQSTSAASFQHQPATQMLALGQIPECPQTKPKSVFTKECSPARGKTAPRASPTQALKPSDRIGINSTSDWNRSLSPALWLALDWVLQCSARLWTTLPQPWLPAGPEPSHQPKGKLRVFSGLFRA